jgi:hypothetical protein
MEAVQDFEEHREDGAYWFKVKVYPSLLNTGAF